MPYAGVVPPLSAPSFHLRGMRFQLVLLAAVAFFMYIFLVLVFASSLLLLLLVPRPIPQKEEHMLLYQNCCRCSHK